MLRTLLLLGLLASATLAGAQDADEAVAEAPSAGEASTRPFDRPDVRRVTEQICCYCGCPHMQVSTCFCGVADRVREETAAQLDAGMTEQEVVDAYVAEHGTWVMAVPPREGFHLSILVLPVVVLVLGGALVFYLGRKYVGSSGAEGGDEATAPTDATPNPELSRHQAELERLLEEADR